MEKYERTALSYIRDIVQQKVAAGMNQTDAVYQVKRELVNIKSPYAAGDYGKALDVMQRGKECTPEAALVALKLLVRSNYNDPTVWN